MSNPYRTPAPKKEEYPVNIELSVAELQEAAQMFLREKYGLAITKGIIGQPNSEATWHGLDRAEQVDKLRLRITNVRRDPEEKARVAKHEDPY
jgi:hypothetical protein